MMLPESNDNPILLLRGKKYFPTAQLVRVLHLWLRTDVTWRTSSRSICVSALTDKFIRSKSKRFSHFELVVPPLSFTLKGCSRKLFVFAALHCVSLYLTPTHIQ